MPRKMFPPPTTRHSSCPCDLAAAISPARPATASGSMPNWPCPISASPDSLSKIRLKRGRVMRFDYPLDATKAALPLWPSRPVANCQAAVLVLSDRLVLLHAGGSRNFGRKIVLLLFD